MYDPKIHHRRSIRLRGYDYSLPGAYYATICIQNHKCLLGEVVQGRMNLNDQGLVVDAVWQSIPCQFATVELDEYIVMPNHFHGIFHIVEKPMAHVGAPLVGARKQRVGAPLVGALPDHDRVVDASNKKGRAQGPPLRPTVGAIVGAFKSLSTDEYIRGVKKLGWPRFARKLWQKNFYEHIIRDDDELNKIREYVRQNPLMWTCDRYNPERGIIVIDEEGRAIPWDES
jgi:REP-associated tyrosine transposase